MALTAQQIADKKAKRTKLLNDRVELIGVAEAAKRNLTPEEHEKLASWKTEADAIGKDVGVAEEALRSIEEDGKEKPNVTRKDTADELMQEYDEKSLSGYSVLRVARRIADQKPLDGIEGEVHTELTRRALATGQKSPKGIMVPIRALAMPSLARRTMNTTTGSGALKTAVASYYIDLLRPLTMIGQLGATMLGGLIGSFGIPKQTGGATAYWYTDGNAPSASNQTIGQVVLTPKSLGAYTDITRQMMIQSSVDIEMLVRNDLFKQIAVAVDQAAVNGSGSAGQPLGILNDTGIPTLNCAGTPTYANIVAMETIVADANVMIENGAYLGTPGVRGILKTTPKIGSTYPVYLWDDNELNGYPAHATNIVPHGLGLSADRSALIFGNWVDMVLGMWGAVDLLVDPYSLSTSGSLRLVVLQDVDVEFRQKRSFVKMPDINATGQTTFS